MLIQRTVSGVDVRAEVEIDEKTGEVNVIISRDGEPKARTMLRGSGVDAVDVFLADEVTGYVTMHRENIVKIAKGRAQVAYGKGA